MTKKEIYIIRKSARGRGIANKIKDTEDENIFKTCLIY